MPDGTVILGFLPTSALLGTGFKKEPTSSTITFDLESEPGQTVKTPTGDDLVEQAWTLQLYNLETHSESAEKVRGIGFMSHHDSPRGTFCHISVGVGKEVFDRLLSALVAGRMPRNVFVHVKGLTYGRNIEGRDKVWDIREDDYAPVVEISFTVPIGAQTADPDAVREPSALPINMSDLEALHRSLRKELRESTRVVVWPLFIIAAAVILVGLKILLK